MSAELQNHNPHLQLDAKEQRVDSNDRFWTGNRNVPKQEDTKLVVVTLFSLYRLSKFFHWWTHQ